MCTGRKTLKGRSEHQLKEIIYGIFKRPLGLSESAEKILVAAADPHFAVARLPDRIYRRLRCRAVHLHAVLKISMKRKMNIDFIQKIF